MMMIEAWDIVFQEIAELKRKIESMVDYAHVEAVEGMRVQVKTIGGAKSDFIPYLQASGKDQRKPKVGDLVSIICPSGELSGAKAIGTILKKEDEREGELYREFTDGTSIMYDSKSSTLTVQGKDLDINIDAKTLNLKCSGTVNVKAEKVTLNDGLLASGVVTKNCICAFTGLKHPDASTTVIAGK